MSGVAYEARGPDADAVLAREALDALEADPFFVERLGPQFVQAFLAMKRSEVSRFASAVTDWELNEYANVL